MDNYIEKLTDAGLKITPRRKALIRLFSERATHLTPEEVWNSLKKKFVKLGLPGVYRNLESLAECGILARIHQFDGKKHYGLCPAGGDNLHHARHHHHIVCVKCGKVDDIEGCAIEEAVKIKGYKIVSHFLQVNGVCAACSGK